MPTASGETPANRSSDDVLAHHEFIADKQGHHARDVLRTSVSYISVERADSGAAGIVRLHVPRWSVGNLGSVGRYSVLV